MAPINRVIVFGRLTRDPELRELRNGGAVCEFAIAWNHRRKNGEEWEDAPPEFYEIVAFGNRAEHYAEHLSKGEMVGVEGRLRYESWETEGGDKRSRIRVQAFTVQWFKKGEGGGEREGGYDYDSDPEVAAAGSGFAGGPDDDIPF